MQGTAHNKRLRHIRARPSTYCSCSGPIPPARLLRSIHPLHQRLALNSCPLSNRLTMLSLIAGRTIARQAQLMAVFQCCNRVYATKAVKAPKEKKAPKTAKVPKEKPMPKPKEKKVCERCPVITETPPAPLHAQCLGSQRMESARVAWGTGFCLLLNRFLVEGFVTEGQSSGASVHTVCLCGTCLT